MSEEFRDHVLMVSKHLSSEETHDLAYLYKLPAQFLEPTCRSMHVLVQMEAQQIIKASSPDTLAVAMERINRKDLASKVRKLLKKKKNERLRKPCCDNEDVDCEKQYQNSQIGLAMWHAEIAAQGIRQLLKSWNCQEATEDMITAMQQCDIASEKLKEATRKFELRDSPFPVATMENNSDEENSPSPLTSKLVLIIVLYFAIIHRYNSRNYQSQHQDKA